jgi:hypothetical protein
MKKLLASIALLIMTAQVFAACPAPSMYRCYQAVNGKMICGCF